MTPGYPPPLTRAVADRMAFVSDVEIKPAPLDAWRASCRGNPNIAEYRELHRRVRRCSSRSLRSHRRMSNQALVPSQAQRSPMRS